MSVLREGSGARWLTLIAGAIIVSLLALTISLTCGLVGSEAVHDENIFELEGDIVENGNAADGPDWGAIFNASGAVVNLFGGEDAAFLMDDLSQSDGTDDTVFAGSNKNNDLISTWNWNTGNAPAKDDLSNVYVYARRDASGDLILYTGLERLAENGDSHVDVQFYRQDVGLDKATPCGSDLTAGAGDGAPCEFTGEKSPGDLMVSMDFENGGALGIVRIFQWNAAAQEYDLIFDLDGEGCNPSNGFPADVACAFNSPAAGIDGGPWPNYDRHGNVVTTLPGNAFTEVGVNVSEVLGFVCINSVVGKTRTSQSITSELKDFTPPQAFEVCDLDVEKTGSDTSKVGDDVSYEITITNSGGVPLYKQSIIDSLLGDLTDGTNAHIDASDCGASLAAGDSCTITLTYTVQPGDPDPLPNTVDIVYDSQANLSGGEASGSSSHDVNLFQPAIAVDKSADRTLGHIGDAVNYTFVITNNSSADSPDLVADSVVDDVLGDLLDPANPFVTSNDCGASLASGASCTVTATRAIEALDDDPLVNTVTVHYHPDGFPNDITASDSHTVDIIHPDIEVVKECTPQVHPGDVIGVTASVDNTGDTPLHDVTVTDSLAGPLTYASGDTNGNGLLDTDEVWVFTGSYVAPQGTESSNTVTATGFNGDNRQVQDSDDCTTDILNPDIAVVKQCTPQAHPGDEIGVSALVTNPGDTPLGDVSATDDLAGPLAYVSGDSNSNGLLDPGEEWLFEGSYTAPAGDTSSNTVTAQGTDGLNDVHSTVTATDDCTTDILNPDIAVVKQCTPQAHPGDEIDVSALVTNPGDTPLGNVSVSDSLAGPLSYVSGDSNSNSLLDPGEAWLFEGSYTAPAGDTSSNTVTATAMDALQREVEATDDCTTDILNPDIAVVKECTPQAHPGDDIDVSALVTNPGDTPLSDVTVTDSLAGSLAYVSGDDNLNGLLDTNEAWLFQGSYTAPEGNTSSNTVTATAMDALEATVQDTDDCTTDILNPAIIVVKECTPQVHPGDEIDVAALVSNPGDTALSDVSVSDSLAGALTYVSGDDNSNGLLDTNEAWLFEGSYTAPGGDTSSNTVTATAMDALEAQVQDTDDCTTDILNPAIEVVKECTGLAHPGEPITVFALVSNPGDTPLSDVTVSDSLAGPLTYVSGDDNSNSLLDTNEAWLYQGSYIAPEGDVSSNTVTATAMDALEAVVEDTDDCTTDILNPAIVVVKECTPQVHVGDDIDVAALVTNPGDTPLTDVTVTDSLAGPLSYVSGDDNNNGQLDPGEGWLFEGSYTAPAGDSSSNTVTATAMDALEATVQDTDDCTTDILNPAIVVVKECTSIVQIGDTINVVATVTNPGDTPLADITVTDDLAGTLTYVSGDDNSNDLLDPGEEWVFTGSHVATDTDFLTDTVTAEGTDVLERTVSDQSSCVTEIDHLPEVEVDKTADGSDPDQTFTDNESTTVDSVVTYRVIIDNDSSEPVTITSLLDDTYPGIVCRDENGDDVIGKTLEADDGDGAGSMNGGADEITCTFQATAPSTPETSVTDVVTVEVVDEQENTASDDDDAAVRTLPRQVLGPTPTPTPVASPAVLPPTGGLGALTRGGPAVILLATVGFLLIAGSALALWTSRQLGRRRG